MSGATLTNREHEVARLAADGLSNVEIAKRLFLSPRTVEGHLLRASRKAGVRRRDRIVGAVASGAAVVGIGTAAAVGSVAFAAPAAADPLVCRTCHVEFGDDRDEDAWKALEGHVYVIHPDVWARITGDGKQKR